MKRLVGLLSTAAIALAMISGCQVVEESSTTAKIRWTIDGSSSATACDTFGIDYFVVSLSGPEQITSREVGCGGGWQALFVDPLEGAYQVTVTAYDSAGAVVGNTTGAITVDFVTDPDPTVTIDFSAADLGGTTARQSVVVSWTIKGSTATTACATYGIDNFVVELKGPDNGNSTPISCGTGSAWQETFPDFLTGSYTVTVTAYDGSGGVVGSVGKTGVDVVAGTAPTAVSLDFQDADLGIVANAKINVFWNINGTVEGTAKGTSWDSCAEVGAKSAVVTVDGQASTHDCDASGNMATTISGLNDGQTYAIKVKLVDATGKDLTTEVSDNIIASNSGGELVGDFFFNSFFEPKKTGTEGMFHFQTSYENKSCDGPSPQVAAQISLVRTSDQQPVTPVFVCDVVTTDCNSGNGVAADGVATLACSDLEQVLSSLPWGSYTLELQGSTDSLNVCWEYKDTILIGAGTSNPKVDINLARLSGVTCI